MPLFVSQSGKSLIVNSNECKVPFTSPHLFRRFTMKIDNTQSKHISIAIVYSSHLISLNAVNQWLSTAKRIYLSLRNNQLKMGWGGGNVLTIVPLSLFVYFFLYFDRIYEIVWDDLLRGLPSVIS